MTRQEMLIAGGLYVIIGALTPVLSVLATGIEINERMIATMIVGALIGGAGACKAFTSTTFADNQVEGGKPLKPSIKKK